MITFVAIEVVARQAVSVAQVKNQQICKLANKEV